MKAITGYEGRYAVTATGEVWSLPKMVPVGANGGMRVQPLRRLSATRGRSLGAHLRVYLAKEAESVRFGCISWSRRRTFPTRTDCRL